MSSTILLIPRIQKAEQIDQRPPALCVPIGLEVRRDGSHEATCKARILVLGAVVPDQLGRLLRRRKRLMPGDGRALIAGRRRTCAARKIRAAAVTTIPTLEPRCRATRR